MGERIGSVFMRVLGSSGRKKIIITGQENERGKYRARECEQVMDIDDVREGLRRREGREGNMAPPRGICAAAISRPWCACVL